MIRYFVERPDKAAEEINAAAYDVFVSGTAIRSTRGDNRSVELELSENLKVRTFSEGTDCYVILSSTLTKGEIPPVRIQLVSGHQEASAVLLEKRLHHLRQTYAVVLLIESGRIHDLAKSLEQDWDRDLEFLLDENDRLVVQAAGEGSAWVTVWKKAAKVVSKAPEAGLLALSGLFKDGRGLLLEYVRAVVDTKKANADLTAAEAEKKKAEANTTLMLAVAQAKVLDADAEKKLAEAENIRAQMRKQEEEFRLERLSKELDLYEKADKALGKAKSEPVKKKIRECLAGTNPDVPRLPPPVS